MLELSEPVPLRGERKASLTPEFPRVRTSLARYSVCVGGCRLGLAALSPKSVFGDSGSLVAPAS